RPRDITGRPTTFEDELDRPIGSLDEAPGCGRLTGDQPVAVGRTAVEKDQPVASPLGRNFHPIGRSEQRPGFRRIPILGERQVRGNRLQEQDEELDHRRAGIQPSTPKISEGESSSWTPRSGPLPLNPSLKPGRRTPASWPGEPATSW